MSDRLAELKRQQELLREQAARLAREIAAAESTEATGAKPAIPTAPPGPVPSPAADAGDDPAAQFGAESATAVDTAKRGCWIVFLVALLALGLGTLGWYLLIRNS